MDTEIKVAKYAKILEVLRHPKIMLNPWYIDGNRTKFYENGIIEMKRVYNRNPTYNVNDDIIEPFSKKLPSMTLEMMETANNSKYVKDCLKIIHKDYIEILIDVLDMYSEIVHLEKREIVSKREIYIDNYRTFLLRFQHFLDDFITKDEIDTFGKEVVVIDWEIYSKRWALEHLEYNEDKSAYKENYINPYPRIFTSEKAYDRFMKLLEAFGNTDQNLANYSFIYHRMKSGGMIYNDIQKLEFSYFLLNFDINIDRIKRIEDIGKITFRDNIYNQTK